MILVFNQSIVQSSQMVTNRCYMFTDELKTHSNYNLNRIFKSLGNSIVVPCANLQLQNWHPVWVAVCIPSAPVSAQLPPYGMGKAAEVKLALESLPVHLLDLDPDFSLTQAARYNCVETEPADLRFCLLCFFLFIWNSFK